MTFARAEDVQNDFNQVVTDVNAALAARDTAIGGKAGVSGAGVQATAFRQSLNLQSVALSDYAVSGVVVQASFQSAVDALSDEGGRVVVKAGDYSAIDPDLISVPLHKMVTWDDPTLSLPDGMPGAVLKSGYGLQFHEGGLGASSRPGDKFVFYKVNHNPDPAQVNQQDSVIYIEGSVPNVSMPLDNEFAGIRINMETRANDVGAAIRGLHATMTGVGGKGKLRAVRVTSIGLDGHDGLVVGGLFSAVRTGLIPTSAGGNGVSTYASGAAGPYPNQDYAMYGAVGPGIRGVLLLGGQEGKERPQTGIQQARGAQALLPEIAFIDMHGGGNGHLVRVLQSEDVATEIARWERTGKLAVPGLRSSVVAMTIADDAVATFSVASTSGFLKFWTGGASISSAAWGEIFFRTATGGGTAVAASGTLGSATTLAAAGTVLAGTTGTDGRATISLVGDTFYIENRTGGARNFHYLVTGA